jgi:hypothetical protein
MLRRSFTAVLERNTRITGPLTTEPYEVAWATEVRVFVRVMEISSSSVLTLRPRISPDGLFWCDEGSKGLEMTAPGLASFPLRDFGHWLQFEASLDGPEPFARILITLALKE